VHNGIGLVKLMGRYSGEMPSVESPTFSAIVMYKICFNDNIAISIASDNDYPKDCSALI